MEPNIREKENATATAHIVAKELGLTTSQAKQAAIVAMENLLLFDKKQKDYGPYNICGNPHPQLGVAFRADDQRYAPVPPSCRAGSSRRSRQRGNRH